MLPASQVSAHLPLALKAVYAGHQGFKFCPSCGSVGANSQRDEGAFAPYPYHDRMEEKGIREDAEGLQIELLKVQDWVKKTDQKIVALFEGWDGAGKGGTIKRFRKHLKPRGARVVALEKPNETERGQWYFQRYTAHLPTHGEIVFFDRSWYNRAGVEPLKHGKLSPIDRASMRRFDLYNPGPRRMFLQTLKRPRRFQRRWSSTAGTASN